MKITFKKALEIIYNYYGKDNVIQVRKPDGKPFYIVDEKDGKGHHITRDDLIEMIGKSRAEEEKSTKPNETVKVYSECLNADGYGDFVKCTDCEVLMLIPLGGMACKNCGSENMLWANEECHECSVTELERMGYNFEIISK